MSPPGQRLNNMTGIAAILRFVMPQLDQMVEADEGDLDSDQYDSEHMPTTDEEQQFSSGRDEEERKSGSDYGSNSQFSEGEQGFLDDVFA